MSSVEQQARATLGRHQQEFRSHDRLSPALQAPHDVKQWRERNRAAERGA